MMKSFLNRIFIICEFIVECSMVTTCLFHLKKNGFICCKYEIDVKEVVFIILGISNQINLFIVFLRKYVCKCDKYIVILGIIYKLKRKPAER